MRSAKAKDYWKETFLRNYDYTINNINLNGVGGINKVEFNNGIFAICGLNGAGKSTIISSLKDILGLKTNHQDTKKVNGIILDAEMINKGIALSVSNKGNSRFLDLIDNKEVIYYLDYKQSIDILEYLEQDNLDELLEQFDESLYTSEMLIDINYIVGKEYDEIKVIEVEDGEKTIPYFKVRIHDLEYDSLAMGIGEHILFYIYWVFNRIKESGIVLIEEPETFISINSQNKLMDFVAKKSSKVGITVIVATHSPYIIKSIKKENVCIVSRYSKYVSVIKPSIEKDSLFTLGLEIPKRGCIFVEDNVSELFLKTLISKNCDHILREYNIEKVNGESAITERLRFPSSEKFTFKIIGIYDGDMKNNIDKTRDKINWDYCFLPTTDAVEIVYKTCLKQNLAKFVELTRISEDKIVHVLSMIDGDDHHDWLLNFSRLLGMDVMLVIEKLYEIWEEDETNRSDLDSFIQILLAMCI
ncbi:MAG: hypothetical protein JWM44_3606 [Bacilli bacterium]|nr:hypothetical protein [Bacilli bacterium]